MGHLCIGSYSRILTSCAISAEGIFNKFCEKLMLSLCAEGVTTFSYTSTSGDVITYSDTNFNKILSGSQNLPNEVMQMAVQQDKYAVLRYFDNKIIPALDESRKENAVMALKYVILQDPKIPDSTQLGTLASLTKAELREKKAFILSEFLADIFLFTVKQTDNTAEVEYTKSIKKNFYQAYDPMKGQIRLYKPSEIKSSAAIPLTVKGNFKRTFTPVSVGRLTNASSRHDLQIFALKFEDKDFDYEQLWRYLRLNIGYYVYSRAEIQEYMDNDEIGALSYDAVTQLKMHLPGGQPTGEELGEMLLYIFMEQVLSAPKFMSCVELSNYGGPIVSNSSGIHILTAEGAVPFSQIVFGASYIEGDLRSAIADAFKKATDLKKRKKKERMFVESKIFSAPFSKEESAALEKIILPSEDDKAKPDTAFGMFVGYSLSPLTDPGISASEYQSRVTDQITADINAVIPYIDSLIDKAGMNGDSFYIYILPFTDADTDKKEMMDKLLQIGKVSA